MERIPLNTMRKQDKESWRDPRQSEDVCGGNKLSKESDRSSVYEKFSGTLEPQNDSLCRLEDSHPGRVNRVQSNQLGRARNGPGPPSRGHGFPSSL
ncbi:hypothetical protein H920_19359 [Fukomys damarensis]|uniref:Uncharacterized protein n=1 Tax=Fukomys damarensis TaxID=885580 RepID=A0A091D8X1_FUKDA|nr:hypothetical protein H920_19359 [Fukomys damarensis]